MVKGGYVPGRTHPTDRARGQTTAMPTAVAAARQSYADHPMVRLETAPPGPCHAVSLQETPSDPCSTSATVILAARWIGVQTSVLPAIKGTAGAVAGNPLPLLRYVLSAQSHPVVSPCQATRTVSHRRGMRCAHQSASLHFRSKSQPHLAVILLTRWKQLLVIGDIQQVEPG